MSNIKHSLLIMIVLVSCHQSLAQENADELAQKLQNPLANISLLPIQNNFGFGASQNNALGYGLSFQPIHATSYKKFNIIHRAVFGLGYVPGITGGLSMLPQGSPEGEQVDGVWGLTDLNYSFLYAPKSVGKIAWGIGPSLNLPTATDNRLGTDKWSAGVSGVVVYQINKWTVDLIFRQIWSFAGDENRADVNQMVIQPLIAFNIGNGWVANTLPTINVNWDFEEGQKWMVPVGGGVSKVLFIGKLPMSLGAQYYYHAVRPDLAPTSEFRINTVLVFSK